MDRTPDWADVRVRGRLSAEDESLRRELCAIVAATKDLCERLRKLQAKLDLEDTRKSI